uniref:Uncharacterized protein n=1 Tax=Romanomermis culicivorax TaxID=13658 RepID=A0A915JEF1_ROMCU
MLHDELHYLNCHCELDKHLTIGGCGSADLNAYSPGSSSLGSDVGCFEQQQQQQQQKSGKSSVNNENNNNRNNNNKHKRNKKQTATLVL